MQGSTKAASTTANTTTCIRNTLISTITIHMLYLEINEGKHSLEVKLSCDIVKKENINKIVTQI